jgi:predicted transglutaminase-like cysteine proteinase
MHTGKICAIAFGLTLLGACADLPQQAQLPPTMTIAAATATTIADGTPAVPPPGFVTFCMHNLSVCTNGNAVQPARIVLDDATRSKLIAINDRINNAITYATDEAQYGVANLWTLNAIGGYGNCKDYALTKRQALIDAGLPESALRIAIVRTEQNELHAVLTVDTDHGDFVLDSIDPQIRPWADTRYAWLSRQSASDPLRWVSLARYER